MKWQRRAAFWTACVAMLITLGGCATVSPGSFCTLYAPVYTAKEDTEETRRQADRNNAIWLAFCQRESLS